ncbi:HAMP domain-containing sensor histidine kinase [Sedimentibacter sp.]|uniref:sensor histidine kinase n=1 Tax=Sedimentibacter sp. TaxID=1960295 RepID=UPI0028AC50CB|nr:HAMP domain-containing sensor histidine kinase [Sedimentibacter sp.]
MKIKFTLKNKLFVAILCVLIFNVVLSAILGNTLFDELYTNDKINSLKNGVDSTKISYLSGNINKTVEEIIKYEAQNMTICIFSLNTETGIGEIEYFSRQRYFTLNPFNNEINLLAKRLYIENAFTELNNHKYYIKNAEIGSQDNNIIVLSGIKNNKYILMMTPKKFINDISYSAIKYSIFISVFSLIIVAIIMYFVAKKTTKPISRLQIVADKISNLNFSERCEISSDDEIGLLSHSINNMADKLQDYVERLKDDLISKEKTDKMTKQLIANVSHDFKTPLTLIMSYSEALIDMEDIDEDTKKDYLNIIINEGHKISEFVQELLKLSQIEGGLIKLEKSNFSINEIIEEIINKNSIIAKERNINVEKNIYSNCIVHADYFRIEQVFQNLYENAIKYCDLGGSLRVSTFIDNNKCKVAIFNTGMHIPDEDIENIFLSFYRADKSRKYTGSYGLGLAIVKVIMEMHNEKYGVKNVDNGVEFWFELENIEMNLELED